MRAANWARRANHSDAVLGSPDLRSLSMRGDPEASDKPSDNGPMQRQTQRDVARHRYPSGLR